MAIKPTSPTYKHNCSACVFIAAIRQHGVNADAYICTGNDTSSVIRHSDDGPDYTSWPIGMKQMLDTPALFTDGSYAIASDHLIHKWVMEEAKRRGHI